MKIIKRGCAYSGTHFKYLSCAEDEPKTFAVKFPFAFYVYVVEHDRIQNYSYEDG